jgi:hypothetical protein
MALTLSLGFSIVVPGKHDPPGDISVDFVHQFELLDLSLSCDLEFPPPETIGF